MRAIMVMFDSLNRHMLPPYGCDWVKAPNFQRLSEKTVVFDNSYVGSMPCMPARRELHTGRYNFLHRSWGPLEPFDDSMPEVLGKNGVYTHLVSDHQHYWEDGGCTYHQRYNTWEIVRGQEGDKWKGEVKDPDGPVHMGRSSRQDVVNRKYMQKEEDQPQAVTFKLGFEFLEKNKDDDNWFLQIETFDPHEPYFTQQHYKDLYPHEYDGPQFDWPPYQPVSGEERPYVQHVQYENAALISMCDHYMGKVLDFMDEHDMWKDTMLIVNTDHGFLLGEHDWWAKNSMPFYEEIAHTPLFIWDPKVAIKGVRRSALVQTIDLAPTILDYFNIAAPSDMQGKALKDTIQNNTKVHDGILFGINGGHVNCTNGRYVYMRAPESEMNAPLYEYTLMPTHMWCMFPPEELQNIQLAAPFSFTKGCRTMKIESRQYFGSHSFGTLLFDLQKDPNQNTPLKDAKVEKNMIDIMVSLMRENDCPEEQFKRLGLTDK
ncbi:sulfatase [Lacrimispora sp. 38-1]|uniref:sulfatase n=1 Tax=Lacrimispora sp. 38-1 TaxID=3125778 RepID=UPI003CF0418A